jgi:hypothetical protein
MADEKKKSYFDLADEQAARQRARDKRDKEDKKEAENKKSPTSDITVMGAIRNIMDRKYKNQTTDDKN